MSYQETHSSWQLISELHISFQREQEENSMDKKLTGRKGLLSAEKSAYVILRLSWVSPELSRTKESSGSFWDPCGSGTEESKETESQVS